MRNCGIGIADDFETVGANSARPQMSKMPTFSFCRGRRPRRPAYLLPAESRLCRLYRVSELASGNEAGSKGAMSLCRVWDRVPADCQGRALTRVQRQCLWRVKGSALVISSSPSSRSCRPWRGYWYRRYSLSWQTVCGASLRAGSCARGAPCT